MLRVLIAISMVIWLECANTPFASAQASKSYQVDKLIQPYLLNALVDNNSFNELSECSAMIEFALMLTGTQNNNLSDVIESFTNASVLKAAAMDIDISKLKPENLKSVKNLNSTSDKEAVMMGYVVSCMEKHSQAMGDALEAFKADQ